MSRPSCLMCSRKHVAEAEVLMREAQMGYCLHALLSVGHLSQAEAELLEDFPEMAHIIRAERINYLEGLEYQLLTEENGSDKYLDLKVKYNINTMSLLEQLTILAIKAE